MPKALPRGGEALFLGSTEVLQVVLLPHLSAVDISRLGLCSKGLRSWVSNTPVELWKVSLLAPKAWPAFCQATSILLES